MNFSDKERLLIEKNLHTVWPEDGTASMSWADLHETRSTVRRFASQLADKENASDEERKAVDIAMTLLDEIGDEFNERSLRGTREPVQEDQPHMVSWRRGSTHEAAGMGGIGDPVRALIGEGPHLDDGGFRGMDDFMKTCILTPTAQRAVNVTTGSEGGFAVPIALMRPNLIAVSKKSVTFSRANVIPVKEGAGNEVEFPLYDSFDKSGGLPVAGLAGGWYGEDQAFSEQTPKLRLARAILYKILAATSVTREALDSGPIGASQIMELFNSAFAYALDKAVIRGTGVGPGLLGVINSASALKIPRAAANTIGYGDLVDMVTRIYPPHLGNAVWILSPSALDQLLTMEDTAGTHVWQPQAAPGMPSTLLGKEVVITEHCSALGTEGDICLVDFSQYTLLTRSQFIFQTSESVHWSTDKLAMRAVWRIGGLSIWPEAVKPENQTDTLSWACVLQ